jgi:hypothetical protein
MFFFEYVLGLLCRIVWPCVSNSVTAAGVCCRVTPAASSGCATDAAQLVCSALTSHKELVGVEGLAQLLAICTAQTR